MRKDPTEGTYIERKAGGGTIFDQYNNENDEFNPYEARLDTKSAKKRQNDKKVAFSASYSAPKGYLPGQKAKIAAKQAEKRLSELREQYSVKPTPYAKDLDLPSPPPARKKDDPNFAFKKKQHRKKVKSILNRHEEERKELDEFDVLEYGAKPNHDYGESWDDYIDD